MSLLQSDNIEQNIKQLNLLKSSSAKGLQPSFIYFSSHVSSHLKADNVLNSAAAVTMATTFV